MTEAAFPNLAPSQLVGLDLLQTPVVIFCGSERRIVWSNAGARAMFGAGSPAALDPSSASDAEAAVTALLDESLPDLELGAHGQIVWPTGALPFGYEMAVHWTGIRLDDGREAMLVELRPSGRAATGALEQSLTPGPAAIGASLDTLLEIIPAPTLVIAADTLRVLLANAPARKLLPIDPATQDPTFSFASAQAQRLFRDAAMGAGPFSISVELIDKRGQPFATTLTGKRQNFTDEPPAVVVVIQDIEDIHRDSLDLKAALQIERAVNHQQRRMLDIAAHEFRTPLAVIDGAAQRIARHDGIQAPERTVELAERIREFVAKLADILELTVERARNDIGEIACKPALGHIQGMIAKIASYFDDKADIEQSPEIAGLPPMPLDRVLIEQVLVNLVENAVKYSEGRARIRFSAAVGHDWLELSVRDWGIGIPPEDRERVFTENARGSNVGGRIGTGLGLYIVRGIVRAHGGEVSVAETSGPGTTVKIVLPLRPVIALQRLETVQPN